VGTGLLLGLVGMRGSLTGLSWGLEHGLENGVGVVNLLHFCVCGLYGLERVGFSCGFVV